MQTTLNPSSRRALPRICSLALLLTGLTVLTAPAHAAPRLFSAAPLAEADVAGETVRQRGVRLDLSEFAGAPAAADAAVADTPVMELNLFPDVALEVQRDAVEYGANSSTIWKGHVAGADQSEVTLVVKDGVMIGNVRVNGRQYQVRYAGDGVHAIREIDEVAFAPCAACQAPEAFTPQQEMELVPNTPTGALDDGSVIDVMVVYTPAARAAVGGTTAMQNHIDLAVAETNQGYANSNVIQRVNLVHTAEVSYTHSGNFSTDLDRLTNPSDGYMDNVHTLRNTYGADAVSLFISGTAYCGIGWVMQTPSSAFESNAFNVVAWNCATGYYSFAHEFGHNFGSAHDRANAGVAGSYSYSYGWQNNGVNRSIMAYNCPLNCTRVNYWSNPAISVGGYAMGSASDHNQLSLNNTRSIVANWRQSVATTPTIAWVTPPPGSASGGASVPVTWALSGFSGPITANQAHFGITSVLGSSPVKAGANGSHSHTFTAPNVGTFDSPTTYAYIARALDNGTQVLSPVAYTRVVSGLTPPTVTWITPPPARALSGGTFSVKWQITNYQAAVSTNRVGWGVKSLTGGTADQPGGNGVYLATVTVPFLTGPGTLYYTAYADNGVEFAFATIQAVTINP